MEQLPFGDDFGARSIELSKKLEYKYEGGVHSLGVEFIDAGAIALPSQLRRITS
jgi:hypothetical protein